MKTTKKKSPEVYQEGVRFC